MKVYKLIDTPMPYILIGLVIYARRPRPSIR